MKRKPIKIDWDALEDAFNSQREDVVFYLCRVTGRVLLEGEGEDDGGDDRDDPYEHGVAAGPPARPRNDATRIFVTPPDEGEKLDWMEAFLDRKDGGLDGQVVAALGQAVSDADPADAISEVLKPYPKEREAWFLFRAARMRELIDDWLMVNEVEAVDAPPWRDGPGPER